MAVPLASTPASFRPGRREDAVVESRLPPSRRLVAKACHGRLANATRTQFVGARAVERILARLAVAAGASRSAANRLSPVGGRRAAAAQSAGLLSAVNALFGLNRVWRTKSEEQA